MRWSSPIGYSVAMNGDGSHGGLPISSSFSGCIWNNSDRWFSQLRGSLVFFQWSSILSSMDFVLLETSGSVRWRVTQTFCLLSLWLRVLRRDSICMSCWFRLLEIDLLKLERCV